MDDNEETTLIFCVKPLSFLNRGKQVNVSTQMSINPEGFFLFVHAHHKDKFVPAFPPARLINVGNQSLAWSNLNTRNN